jgi:DNA-binding XRE family transcriptional regulator
MNTKMKHTLKPIYFNSERFIRDIREKRLIDNRMGLREAAKQIGIGSSTLNRIESGKPCDIDTFCLVIVWLAEQPNTYFKH